MRGVLCVLHPGAFADTLCKKAVTTMLTCPWKCTGKYLETTGADDPTL